MLFIAAPDRVKERSESTLGSSGKSEAGMPRMVNSAAPERITVKSFSSQEREMVSPEILRAMSENRRAFKMSSPSSSIEAGREVVIPSSRS